MTHREQFNGQVVRVRGFYGAGYEASVFFDRGCSEQSWVEFDPDLAKRTAPRVFRLFEWLDPPDEVTVVARFRGVGETYRAAGRTLTRRFGHLNGYSTQLEILSIERMRRLHFSPRP
jgi:hypothetical protein